MMRRSRWSMTSRAVAAAGIAAAILGAVTACTLFLGGLSDLVPEPGQLRLLEPPQLLSVDATPYCTLEEDHYVRDCGWFHEFIPWVQTPSFGWVYHCYNAWRWTDCRYDLAFRVSLHDPSGDLRAANSPRLRVYDSEPLPGASDWGECLLDVPRTDVPIETADILGSGEYVTVTVRLRDLRVRYTSTCRSFSARLRCALVFDADGEPITSANSLEVDIILTRR
jgi:hypothetical protein